jgi:flagellar basal-body rod protein FlgC
MLRSLDISTSALIAQRQRMNTIAENIAHMNTTRDENGNSVPFQRRLVLFQTQEKTAQNETRGLGVNYEVQTDTSTPPRPVLEPGHPDANADGIVNYPNINVVTEYVNATEASRAYEANLMAINISKQMAQQSLRILE